MDSYRLMLLEMEMEEELEEELERDLQASLPLPGVLEDFSLASPRPREGREDNHSFQVRARPPEI